VCISLGCGNSEPRVPNIEPPEPPAPKPRISLSFDELTRLRAEGNKVVNAQNQEAVLRAVGLGYWLLQEGYMLNPHDQGKAANQWQMKRIYYNAGLSEAAVETFDRQWRNTFVTRKDIDYTASLGFNAVRLPLHYDLLLTAAQRAVRHDVIREQITIDDYTHALSASYDADSLFARDYLERFVVIDQLLEWCEANNLYVVLDLHAAPGGQGTDIHIADVFEPNHFWLARDNRGRPIYQDITVKLWETI